MTALPSVSVVIPTLDCARLLDACLARVRAQDYPRDLVEVVVADGGSKDDTVAVATRHGARVVPNPLRTAEAGKAAGVRAARNDVVALVDSDNLLEGDDWLRRMVAPFADPDVVASEPIRFTWRREDSAVSRYCALLGMNDPLCYYVGNYDRECGVTGRWTGLRLAEEPQEGWRKVQLDSFPLPTIGANGFLARRALLADAAQGEYLFDVDVLAQRVARAPVHVAKVDVGIVHLYARDMRAFARKQRRRIVDYQHFQARQLRHYPWQAARGAGVAKFVISTLLVVPLLVTATRGWLRKRDAAWFLHVPACWVTLWVYGAATLRARLRGATGIEKERPTNG